MKKALIILISALLLLAGCESAPGDKRDEILEDTSTGEIALVILEEIEIPSAVEKSREDLPDFFRELDITGIEEVSFYICGSGAFPDELLIIKFKTNTDATNARAAVQSRLESRTNDFRDYAPAEMYKLENAGLQIYHNWFFFFVTEDNTRVRDIINSFL
ncbi:MAG: DUF4358 domain-containing protein [Oscillospiraceae bacterium]|nr:DUF4358 domain-containing protein [Oscillospiraceae bacterium]